MLNDRCSPINCHISEDLLCKMNSTEGTNFEISLQFRDNPLYTEVVFLDFDEWINNGNIEPNNDALCVSDIINGEAMFNFDSATAPTCGIAVTSGVGNCYDTVRRYMLCYLCK